VVCSSHSRKKPLPHYTFLLPDGYIAWVQVIFSDRAAIPFPVRPDGGRVIDVPESGIARTSNLHVHDMAAKDEFYYRRILPKGEIELRRVPNTYVISDIDHGGFGVADTGGEGEGYSWFLFIGPPEIRALVPEANYETVIAMHTNPDGHMTKIMVGDTYPTPGRMSAFLPSRTPREDFR
jgi:uncharacterized protein DUF6843